jgi:hypothetical protein
MQNLFQIDSSTSIKYIRITLVIGQVLTLLNNTQRQSGRSLAQSGVRERERERETAEN